MASIGSRIILLFLACCYLASAKTIPIKAVGLAFDPELVSAAVGDILEFHFFPINHSVVMGDFNSPCVPVKTGGFFSGFLYVASGESPDIFRVTVNNTDPMVYYCSQNLHQHCTNGMVGVVNTDNATLQMYKAGARGIETAVSPAQVFGGDLIASGQLETLSTTATMTGTLISTATATATATTTIATGSEMTTADCASMSHTPQASQVPQVSSQVPQVPQGGGNVTTVPTSDASIDAMGISAAVAGVLALGLAWLMA